MIETTTLARVKTYLDLATAQRDALLAQLITGVSADVERFLNRHTEETSRTEQFDIDPGQTKIFLRGYPVDTGSTFEVKFAHDRDFAAATAVDTENYYLDAARGILKFDHFFIPDGPGVLQIEYTGGMGTSAADLISNFPSVAQGTDIQVAFLFKRRETLGISAFSAEGGSISMELPVELIPMAKTALSRYRRMDASY